MYRYYNFDTTFMKLRNVYAVNWLAKAPGEIPSAFLKAVKNVLRVVNPDNKPMASMVISTALSSFMRFLACFTRHSLR